MRTGWKIGIAALLAALSCAGTASAQDDALIANVPPVRTSPAPTEPALGVDTPTSVFDAAARDRETGLIPEFGVGAGLRLKLSGSVRGRVESLTWTLEDTLPVFPGHDHDEHRVHTTSGSAHNQHGLSDIENDDVLHFESRVRFGGDLIIDDRFSMTLRLQHTRRWSDERDALANLDQLDLYEGSVNVRLGPERHWELRVGRFGVPNFGDERIMSSNEWDSLGRALDGVSATWSPEAFGLTILLTNTGDEDPVRSSYDDEDDLWFGGVALEFRQVEWLDVDFYTFGRYYDRRYVGEEHTPHPPHSIRPGVETGRRADVTIGSLVALKGGGVRLVGEIYGQLGRHGPDDVRAWASAERIEYTPWQGDLYGMPSPTVFFEHAFASGDKRYTDGVRNTFDPLFANRHDHLGPFDAVGYRNISALAVGFSQSMGLFWNRLTPITFTFVARGSFLDSQNDAWYDADGEEVLRDPTGDVASSTTLEGELSGWFTAELLGGNLEFSAGLAHWCPNNLATDLNFHEHAYRVWFSTQVKF